MTPAELKFARGGLILLFGALPASFSLPLAVFGIIGGLGGLLAGDSVAVAYLLLGMGGVYGTASLWILVFKDAGAVTVVGLFSGAVAMLCWAGVVIWAGTRTFTVRELAELAFFNIAPIVVALFVMAVFYYRKSREPLSID